MKKNYNEKRVLDNYNTVKTETIDVSAAYTFQTSGRKPTRDYLLKVWIRLKSLDKTE